MESTSSRSGPPATQKPGLGAGGGMSSAVVMFGDLRLQNLIKMIFRPEPQKALFP